MPLVYASGDVVSVEWDARPIRVIQADPIETFYDVEWEEIGWGLERARSAIFYRVATDYLARTAQLARSQPLSSKSFGRLRPDLPMRLFQHRNVNWSDDRETLQSLEPDQYLGVQQLAIIPFGAKGGAGKPRRVGPEDDLTLGKLVDEARTAQRESYAELNGVGIYRSGIVGNVPSYYLWGAVDRAGHAV